MDWKLLSLGIKRLRFGQQCSKKPGYTLVELLVVLLIIAILTSMSVPGLLNSDERYYLNAEASKLRQMMITARTYSLAPTKAASGSAAQMYQVAMGQFTNNSLINKTKITGDTGTNQVALQKGPATCSDNLVSGATSTVKSYQMRRGIYVSSFYPMDYLTTDSTAVVRFTIGRAGFICGESSRASIDSLDFQDTHWQSAGSSSLQSRYLVIELSAQKISSQVYVILDRLNSEIAVSRFNPLRNFTSIDDTFSPQWRSTSASLTVDCAPDSSVLTLKFSRADDRYEAAQVDANRPVFYDIAWKFGDPSTDPTQYSMLASSYFYDLGVSPAVFTFSSQAITQNSQSSAISFKIWATDTLGNYQKDSEADASLQPRDISFPRSGTGAWSCGATAQTGGGDNDTGSTPPDNQIIYDNNPPDDDTGSGGGGGDANCVAGPGLPCPVQVIEAGFE